MITSWNQIVVAYELRDGRMPTSTHLVNVQMAMYTSLTPNGIVGKSHTTVSMAHSEKGQLAFLVGNR